MADLLNGGNGSSVQWPGAIIGDLPNPYGAAVLSATQFLTTGDLQVGDPCEFQGQSVFTVEFWFKTSGLPVGAEDIANGPLTATGFSQWRFFLNPGGTVGFTARTNAPATVTATSTSVLTPNTWYHLVGRIDGSFLKLYVNAVEEASSVWSGTGEAMGVSVGNEDMVIGNAVGTQTYSYDELALYRVVALGSDRILAHYQAGRQRGFANNQLPGERAIAALDSVSSHAPRRISSGTRQMVPKFMTGQAPLEELQLARQAENVDATLFISKSGEVVLLDAAHRSSAPYNTVQITIGDAGGTEVAYEDVGMDYSEETLANEWSVSRASPAAVLQTVSDSTSIARYFRRPQLISDLPLTLDVDALAVANGMLAKYKDPILRGTSVSLDAGDPDVADQAFQRDLADRTRTLRTPPGGGARLDQNLFIQQIDISGANDGKPWDVTWGLSPL